MIFLNHWSAEILFVQMLYGGIKHSLWFFIIRLGINSLIKEHMSQGDQEREAFTSVLFSFTPGQCVCQAQIAPLLLSFPLEPWIYPYSPAGSMFQV